jgi:DNA-binding transcriptional MerR regulator
VARTVSEVAALTGITVRTLHHYDDIGLLRPADRSDAGYRLYEDQDLARLHEILVWRSFGFPLDEVRALLDDPAHDPLESLLAHRERLARQLGDLEAQVGALDRAIARVRAREPLGDGDLKALFGGFDPSSYEAEVEARWGDTEAFRESKRRTARYGRAEWEAIRAEADALNQRLAALLRAGADPASPEAREAAEAHRAHTDRWFYPVSPEIHLGLAELYVADPRFAATYDALEPGLAVWLRAAILALHAPKPRRL